MQAFNVGQDLRARRRLSEGLVQGYRRARRGGHAARPDRYARTRSADHPGARRPRERPRQPGLSRNDGEAVGRSARTASVSRQEADEKHGDLAVNGARQRASGEPGPPACDQGFATITAPFAGVVTARNADIGDLVNAGAGAATAVHGRRRPSHPRLCECAAELLAALKPGLTATLRLPDYPGPTFPATVVAHFGRDQRAVGNPAVQLMADNPGGALKPGGYAQVASACRRRRPGADRVDRRSSSASRGRRSRPSTPAATSGCRRSSSAATSDRRSKSHPADGADADRRQSAGLDRRG